MSGDKAQFLSLRMRKGGRVTIGDSKTLQILGNGKIGIRSDRGGEFQKDFISYCEERGISHEFSVPRTPQQNGVVERKNRSLQETVRTFLNERKLPKSFWEKQSTQHAMF
ncbi:hypothetical protein AgCh_028319 [Apium graveolens]